MDEMFAIKCQNCGGPMYSHQAKRSFECAYCGAVIPWQADAGEPKSALGIRHTPLTVVDGLLKLTHVSQLERPEVLSKHICNLTLAFVSPVCSDNSLNHGYSS